MKILGILSQHCNIHLQCGITLYLYGQGMFFAMAMSAAIFLMCQPLGLTKFL